MRITTIDYDNLKRSNEVLKNQINSLQNNKKDTSNSYETRISYVNTQLETINSINYRFCISA